MGVLVLSEIRVLSRVADVPVPGSKGTWSIGLMRESGNTSYRLASHFWPIIGFAKIQLLPLVPVF
jgi:hypothetical protein